MEKNRKTAGADEKTPSRAEYFSWISHTNEGATEKQTLANLGYFKWMHDKFGVELDIYAFDAGNLDGARQTYETLDSPKLKKQFPRGYGPIAEAAAESGARLGVWCGPDGYGDTPEEEAARHELMVSLCRDYYFTLFKIDGVCGQLRKEKQEAFASTLRECREYSPDLILLNHRLELGIAEPYATTFLWQGVETYVDIHSSNSCTAPHNRAFIFNRGEVPGLQRLTEDHGVCISSCNDYFEDDLIYQAFNRNLILAPEIYGNPWLLKDSEQARLAHLFRLHKRLNDILVEGFILDEKEYGKNAISRGNGTTRVLTFGNPSWEKKTVFIALDESIGLESCDQVSVICHHPYTSLVGRFEYGSTVAVNVEPFRAALYEICDTECEPPVIEGFPYEVLGEDSNYIPDKILGYMDGKIPAPDPVKLGSAEQVEIPADIEQLAETTLFTMDNDSLEKRSLRRAGETEYPEVKAARDAFFAQDTYRLRGCDGEFAFDGRYDTFFDARSRWDYGSLRDGEGCLRADLGEIVSADELVIEYFSTSKATYELPEQVIPGNGDYSTVLNDWNEAVVSEPEKIKAITIDVVRDSVHDLYKADGYIMRVKYKVGELRYFRLKNPPDRIYKIAAYKNGEEIALKNPRVNNLLRHYSEIPAVKVMQSEFILRPGETDNRYIAVALEGKHGADRAFAVLSDEDGNKWGAPSRAPSYLSNTWECRSHRSDGFNTYFIPVKPEMAGKKITATVILCDPDNCNIEADIYLCKYNS